MFMLLGQRLSHGFIFYSLSYFIVYSSASMARRYACPSEVGGGWVFFQSRLSSYPPILIGQQNLYFLSLSLFSHPIWLLMSISSCLFFLSIMIVSTLLGFFFLLIASYTIVTLAGKYNPTNKNITIDLKSCTRVMTVDSKMFCLNAQQHSDRRAVLISQTCFRHCLLHLLSANYVSRLASLQ